MIISFVISALQFFLINKFYLLGSGQNIFNSVSFLYKLFFCKLNICFAKDKKRDFKNYFHIDISQ